jgi:hypothetical protein
MAKTATTPQSVAEWFRTVVGMSGKDERSGS